MSAVRIVERTRRPSRRGGDWSAREDALYWTDIIGLRFNRLWLGTGAIDEWPMPEMIGWVIECETAPGFVAGLASVIKTLTFDPLRILAFADFPASQITNVCFARPALDRLFVTSAADGVDEPHAGALFELDPGCRGVAPHRFAG